MVAVIKSGTSIRGTFYYNENKVKEGVAECLMAENYPIDLDQLTEQARLNMLQKVAEMNPDVKRNTLHISLNFAPEEQPGKDTLKQIAAEYMERIGFGEQPYLVYQHYDAGHPHIHIVTLRVKPDGSSIDTYNIGKRLSEPARKELEIKYGLVKAEDHKAGLFQLKAIDARRLEYGKMSTKRAISNILASVLDRYKFTSLTELNAVLKLYNVQAERGQEDTRLYKFKGLVYRVIGPDGKGVSAPIKASAFAYKATLKDIEKRFLRNDVERQQFKPAVKVAIDRVMRQTGTNHFPALVEQLKSSGIDMTIHQSKDGNVYGLTYVDHRNRAVFNGSDLGKNYSAKGIIERLIVNWEANVQQVFSKAQEQKMVTTDTSERTHHTDKNEDQRVPEFDKTILELLLQPEYSNNYLSAELRTTRRKKKVRQHKI